MAMRDARTGKLLWKHSPGIDVTQGVAADIDPRHRGYEAWGGPGGLRDSHGNEIGPAPRSRSFVIWWDGDPLRELISRSTINKWNWQTGAEEVLFKTGTRGRGRRPNLMGDLIGDWREELLMTTTDGRALRLYTTTIPTEHRIYTLMHDPQYRLAVAWQNVVYNKPPHPGFFLGDGMAPPPRPDIRLIGKGEAINNIRADE
jgi:rhamnogalacturonan endolyase